MTTSGPTNQHSPSQNNNSSKTVAAGGQQNDAAYFEDQAVNSNMSGVVQGTAETLLNQLEENLTGERSQNEIDEADLLQSSEPGPLDEEGRSVEDVLSIISGSIYREGEGHLLMKLSDRTSMLSVVSHSLSAYITTLEPAPLQRLSARIANEVGLWMCKLFKFTDGSAYCHDDTREGLVKIARLALHKHYPKMATDGFEALFSRPPVIYLTSNTYLDTLQFVCRQLGLPLSTIKLLKISPEEASNPEQAVEKIITEDKAAGKLPILCVANVHSSLVQSADVCALESLFRRQDVWLHMEGNALAGLILVKGDNNNKSKKSVPTGDSMALTLGSWIGVPAVPFVTLYKLTSNEVAATAAGLTTLNPSVRLNCLPLWCVLRSLGEKQLSERIENIFQMLEVLNNKLGEFPSLRVLSQRSKDEKFVPVSDLLRKDFDLSRVYRTVNPALAFQYVSADNAPDLSVRVPTYFNNLNSWLGQTMQRDCGQVPLEIVDVETTGYVLRLCPFESLAFSGASLTEEDLALFIDGIETQTSILNATVVQREKFIDLIGGEVRLEHVDIAHWAGLGGVRYIPSDFIDQNRKSSSVPAEQQGEGGEEGQTEVAEPEVDVEQVRKNLANPSDENRDRIDHRNIQLVHRLRSSDSAFSLGEGPDGRICIRFGMVSMETDVEELLNLVIKTGIDLDEQVAQLQNMSEVIRKGIEQAQGELQKESDDAIWQEGILRHVPLVGSFYNWISPAQKPQIKGRTLRLEEGKLAKSEINYEKQQLQEQQQKKEDEAAAAAEGEGLEQGEQQQQLPNGDGQEDEENVDSEAVEAKEQELANNAEENQETVTGAVPSGTEETKTAQPVEA